MQVYQGDIFYATLTIGIGSEQQGIRPVLILSNDTGNRFSDTVVVACMTRNLKNFVTHIIVEGSKLGLQYDSAIQLEQVFTVSKQRLNRKVGHAPPDVMEKVFEALDINFGRKMKVKEAYVLDKLIPIEYKTQRVISTKILALKFGTDEKNIQMNFSNNESRFLAGKHYYKLEGDELKEFKLSLPNDIGEPLKYASQLLLWTDRGAARHAKILETDEAWQIYEDLEETYFRVKELQKPQCIEDLIIMQAQSMKELRAEVKELKETQQVIRDTFAELPKDQWRKWANNSLNEIGKVCNFGNFEYEQLRADSYKLLEERAGADLAARLRNGKKRLMDSGATKTKIGEYCRLDAIEEDKRLKEIYTGIIKELRLKHLPNKKEEE